MAENNSKIINNIQSITTSNNSRSMYGSTCFCPHCRHSAALIDDNDDDKEDGAVSKDVNDRDEDEGTEESDQDDEDGDQHDQDSNEVSEYSGTKEFVDHIHDNSSSKATNDVQEQDQVIWIQHYLLIIQRCLNAG